MILLRHAGTIRQFLRSQALCSISLLWVFNCIEQVCLPQLQTNSYSVSRTDECGSDYIYISFSCGWGLWWSCFSSVFVPSILYSNNLSVVIKPRLTVTNKERNEEEVLYKTVAFPTKAGCDCSDITADRITCPSVLVLGVLNSSRNFGIRNYFPVRTAWVKDSLINFG